LAFVLHRRNKKTIDMKNLFFLIAILAGFETFAQNPKVTTAFRYKENKEYDKALEEILPATEHEKTAGKEKTWRYLAEIYFGLATNDFDVDKADAMQKAYEALNKSSELDPRGSYEEDRLTIKNLVRINSLNMGVEAFNESNFAAARDLFILSGTMSEEFGVTDTLAFYNGGLAAEQADDYETAIAMYEKVAETGYLEGKMYLYIANVYTKKEDTEGYLRAIQAGRAAHPNDADLIIYELNHYLSSGDFDAAERNLQLAIDKEPDNKQLYFSLGVVYDNLDNDDKAIEAYEKAIEVDENYFDALYNLGALYFNKGVEMNNVANEIQDNKKYEAARAEAKKVFEQSKPFLERAHELDETDKGALVSLTQLYALLGENDKYTVIKAKLDAATGN
jgi:tetratricopeptide (TPR) repeat protein